jgi:dipeptidyl-peptidase 4
MKQLLPVLLLLIVPVSAQSWKEAQARGEKIRQQARQLLVREDLKFAWAADGRSLVYQVGVEGNRKQGFVVDLATGKKSETNDPQALSKVGNREVPLVAPDRVPRRSRSTGGEQSLSLENATGAVLRVEWIGFDGKPQAFGEIQPGATASQGTYVGHVWRISRTDGSVLGSVVTPDFPSLVKITGPVTSQSEGPDGQSPDGKWMASTRNGSLFLKATAGGEPIRLAEGSQDDGYQGRIEWSPDSTRLIVFRTKAVPQRMVTLIESSPKDQLQPKVETIPYTKPGDAIRQPKPRLFDVVKRAEIPLDETLFANPWSIEKGEWTEDSKEYTFLFNQRGHQVLRILGINAADGKVRIITEEKTDTFIDYSQKTYFQRLPATSEILWMSERDGWNHLYLIDQRSGTVKRQLTKGPWNVRSVMSVDEKARTVLIKALAIHPGQDPYLGHFARISLDGGAPTLLTSGNGDHQISFSPDGNFYTDRWSRVDQPPVVEVHRSSDGKLIAELERADDSAFLKTGWSRPEPFVAKGRDGKTDIHGILVKPSNFDPSKRYPVVEDIYAGPHDFFVPKRYSTWMNINQMAELGFIVVMIDGMGTNWRSKAFHDVAWKNLADSGLPDRIAWMKAAATTRPWMDLTRVGIYGGSAGGQNALSALLHHPEFYKVGVADCGCHDNRMDKIWWNEAWMGWPVDESYARNSNVTDAAKLQGKLLLIVGEIDHNVDPASTLQVANALQKADKDFDMLIITGSDHGAAESPYGSRRRAEFLARNLLATPTSSDPSRN